MATADPPKQPDVAAVDFLVDENGSKIEVPEDSMLRVTTDVEQAVGATGPANWWRLGLIGLGIVVAILLILQLLAGKTGTEMVPGTPTEATTPAN